MKWIYNSYQTVKGNSAYSLPRLQRDPPEADKFPLSAVVAWAILAKSVRSNWLWQLTTDH